MTYNIEEITSLIGAHRYGIINSNISWLLTDSRSLVFPETTLFFALTTPHGDGHLYLRSLHQRGVRNFVVKELPKDMDNWKDSNFLLTQSPLKSLQRLAKRHREEFNIPVIGITGSNGKTIVKEWLYQLLSPDFTITRSPRSYNSQIGVPLSVWLLDQYSQIGIFEAGISQSGEMAALQAIIQPTIGILTNIGNAHQENFNSIQQKTEEKSILFKDAQTVIANSDTLPTDFIRSAKQLLWSRRNPSKELYIKSEDTGTDSTTITYIYQQETHSIRIPFIDNASIENAITCLATCLHIGLTPEIIKERMRQLEPVAMRLEVKEGIHGCTLINDSYNSDFKSLEIALDFMSRRTTKSAHSGQTLILSDILQTGIPSPTLYQDIAKLVAHYSINLIIGVGPEISKYIESFPISHLCYPTTTELIQSGILDSLHDQTILIKGAATFRFGKISSLLSKRVHETTLEVDLNAVIDNLNHYRSFLGPSVKTVCMIKASAYGAGDIEIARTLQEHQVDYLAVAVADEGVALRQAGIMSNIIVMNPEMTSFHELFEYRLEPEVYNFHLLDALIHAAIHEGITGFPVHIKLDTGMHRLGFNPSTEVQELINRLKSQNALLPRSIFSHFVGSDADDFDDFTKNQFQIFDTASLKIQTAFSHQILRHICNTAGIQRFPQYHLDMVRIGLGLYGINPYGNELIHPISTLRTTILQIRDVPADETVGYSRQGVLHRPSRIAALPIGYADGLNRHLGQGKGYCLINGKQAPYVGNICMDVCMVDVTDIACQEGDEAIIFGRGLPVTVLSNLLDTIPYEIITSISPRVKKVYYQG